MIQRIQSLWLFLAAVALIALLFLPVGMFMMPHGLYECTAFKMTQIGDASTLNLPVSLIGILSIIGGFISFLAIFIYKKRSLQIRFTWVAFTVKAFLASGLIGMFLYFKYALDAGVGYSPALILPILGLVFDLLAIKGIQKDEALIKSLDRIR